MLLQDLHPDAPRFPEGTAKRIVQYGEKRLKKYNVECVQVQEKPIHSEPALLQNRIILPDHVRVGKLLGQGSFSSAYEITSLLDGDEGSPTYPPPESSSYSKASSRLVLKILQPKLIEKSGLFAGCAADLIREGILLSRLDHQNILRCYATMEASNGMQAYLSGRHDAFGLILERLDMTLKDQLKEWQVQSSISSAATKRKSSSARVAADAVFQLFGRKQRRLQKSVMQRTDLLCELAEAIRYLHANRILHRDLKPDNLGIVRSPGSNRLTLKVFDLDVCRILPAESQRDPDQTFKMTRHVGSLRYMSPEVGRGEEYNAKADVYAFGLVAFEILSLRKPFEDIPTNVLEIRVFNQGVRPKCSRWWPRPVISLVERCWSSILCERPTMGHITADLRKILDLMCPASDLEQRRLSLKSDHSIPKIVGRRILEESRTQRSESTLEVTAQ